MTSTTMPEPQIISPADSKARLAHRVLILFMVTAAVTAILFFVTAVINPSYQAFIVAGAFLILFLLSLSLLTQIIAIGENQTIFLPFTVLGFGLLALSFLVADTGLPAAVIMIVTGVLISGTFLVGRRSDLGVIAGIGFASTSSAVNVLFPLAQLPLTALPSFAPDMLLGIGIVFIIALLTILVPVISNTISLKLIIVSLLITLIPLVALSIIQFNFLQNALQNQTNQTLSMAAEQAATRLDEFFSSNIANIEEDSKLTSFLAYLQLDPVKRAGSPEEQELALLVESLKIKGGTFLSSIGLLDLQGKVIFDSNWYEIGNNEADGTYFQRPLLTGQIHASPVLFSKPGEKPYLYFTAPIRDNSQKIIGLLRVRYDAYVLQSLLAESGSQLGSRSYAMLVDENHIRLADTITPSQIYKSLAPLEPGIQDELMKSNRLPQRLYSQNSTNLTDLVAGLKNQQQQPFFSAIAIPRDNAHPMSVAASRLTTQSWQVVFMREQAFVTRLLQNQSQTNILIASLLAGLIGIIATILARFISNPIVRLQSTAEKLSSGDLEAQAPIQTSDEIGALGRAFNTMTQQLKTFINELEDRVQDRTRELAKQNEALVFRSQQLQTVADVARQIVSAQELDELLPQITRLVSERFNFYHVGIFLLDENREYAVLRAANSEGGQRMLARKHQLKVGAVGIVGYATGAGQPRIATDVGEDAVYFSNPDLPETRSEMALPLKVGDLVIGALDVQSTVSNAFTQEDIALFTTLADQIAVAIRNNELYSQTVQALKEAQRVHQRYLEQEWEKEISESNYRTYVYTPGGLVAQDTIYTPEIQRSLETGERVLISMPEGVSDRAPVMAIPINLRGQNIGIIQVQEKPGASREWTEDEISIVQSVSDQVSQALENARLFEQTTRRANRERKVLEITSHIRSTNDPQAMLQIALEELQQALHTTRAQILIQVPSSTDDTHNNGHHSSGLTE